MINFPAGFVQHLIAHTIIIYIMQKAFTWRIERTRQEYGKSCHRKVSSRTYPLLPALYTVTAATLLNTPLTFKHKSVTIMKTLLFLPPSLPTRFPVQMWPHDESKGLFCPPGAYNQVGVLDRQTFQSFCSYTRDAQNPIKRIRMDHWSHKRVYRATEGGKQAAIWINVLRSYSLGH